MPSVSSLWHSLFHTTFLSHVELERNWPLFSYSFCQYNPHLHPQVSSEQLPQSEDFRLSSPPMHTLKSCDAWHHTRTTYFQQSFFIYNLHITTSFSSLWRCLPLLLKFNLKTFYFRQNECFICIYEDAPCVCRIPLEVGRGSWSSWNLSWGWWWTGTEPCLLWERLTAEPSHQFSLFLLYLEFRVHDCFQFS